MWISDLSIRRPVLAVMVIGALVALGLVSLMRIGVDLFPRVEFPYVVVNTLHWWRPGRVLVPTEWIAWMSWIELAVHLDLPVERIASAPDYDPTQPVTDADELRVSAHYGHPRWRRAASHGLAGAAGRHTRPTM